MFPFHGSYLNIIISTPWEGKLKYSLCRGLFDLVFNLQICTAGIDILRDEGMLYAERLKEFEVNVQHNHYESAYHGFFVGLS